MKFKKVKLDEMESKLEILGTMEIAYFSSMLSFSANGGSLESMREIFLKIRGIHATSWNLFPLAVSAGEGNEKSLEMFNHVKEQLIWEVEHLISLADEISEKVTEINKQERETNEKNH